MARLEDTRNAGICLRAQSEVPVDLLTHHVTTGFLNISEATLRKLAKSQDWSEFGSLSGVPEEMSLVAHCMLNLSPGMLKEDFVDRVLAREQSQKYAIDFLEEDMAALIRDTMEPEDQEKALNAVRPDVKDKSLLRDSAGKVFDHAIKRLPKNKRDQGDATRKEFPETRHEEIPRSWEAGPEYFCQTHVFSRWNLEGVLAHIGPRIHRSVQWPMEIELSPAWNESHPIYFVDCCGRPEGRRHSDSAAMGLV